MNTADDAWLVAVSKAGTFLWERQFGESLDDEAASITTVTSGGVAVTGAWHAEATSGTDVWMSRLDDWGHASCETSGVCAALPDDSCDDQNACTWDGCDAGAGCYHAVASDGVPCNAGSCTVGDVCEGGECTSGGAPSLYERAFGAGANDHGAGIVERAGGGFAVAGISAGSSMMVLTDASGNAVDTRVFNAGNYSGLDAIVNMPDGGFAMVGVTEAGGFGLRDYRIIKATASGSVVWDKAFGGNSYDNAFDIVALPDGGVAVIGASSSFKSDGPNDFWVVRTTSGGGTMWNRSYAAGGDEYGTGLTAIGTDGFALTGFTTGKGAGGHDAWLVRTTPDGERIWDATYGGPGDDSANKVGLLPDGGFVLVGQTKSQGAGEYDLWVVRTSATGTALWEKVLGKSGPDHGHDVLPMADGRIVVVGSTREIAGDDQGWLVVLDGDGNLEWEREYGGGGNDSLRSIVGSSDGFAVAGETTSIGAGLVDAWLLRVDSWGHASCQEAGLCASTPFPECEPDGACSLASCSPQTGCTTEPRDGERWRTAKSLPAPRFGMATVATTGRIYSLGGSANGLTQASEVLMADIVEDGLLGDWKATTPLPHARQELEAVVVGQRVFAIAGGDKYGQYATVDSAPILADGSLGSWTSCPDLPEPRTSFAAVADESRIYALGGNANNKNTASVVMASVGGDGTLSTWTSVTSLPHALTSHGAVIAGGHIHVLGGGDGSYRGTAISSPILPDGSLGAWSTTGDPGTQMNSMAVVASARIWLLGGDEPLEPAVRWSDASDILTQWAVASPQPLASADGGAVEWNHRVYVVGGRTASGATSSVHVMDACPN